jgi:hypothetical protein
MDLKPATLTDVLRHYTFAYLITAGEAGHAHAVPVTPVLNGRLLTVNRPGRRTLANVARMPVATLVWPPAEPDGYSLIVDGDVINENDTLQITATRAVLNRTAPAAGPGVTEASPAPAGTCASDCVVLRIPAALKSA